MEVRNLELFFFLPHILVIQASIVYRSLLRLELLLFVERNFLLLVINLKHVVVLGLGYF